MKVLIQKTWTTEATIDVPEGLAGDDLREWAVEQCDVVAQDDHVWDGTVITAVTDGQMEAVKRGFENGEELASY